MDAATMEFLGAMQDPNTGTSHVESFVQGITLQTVQEQKAVQTTEAAGGGRGILSHAPADVPHSMRADAPVYESKMRLIIQKSMLTLRHRSE